MPLTQADYRAKLTPGAKIRSSDVAKLPKPGTGSVPSSIQFHYNSLNNSSSSSSSSSDEQQNLTPWLTYLAPSDPTSLSRQLWATKVHIHNNNTTNSSSTSTSTTSTSTVLLLDHNSILQEANRKSSSTSNTNSDNYSLEEQLRRERARIMATGVTNYMWSSSSSSNHHHHDDNDITTFVPKVLVPLGGALWVLDDPLKEAGVKNDNKNDTMPIPVPRKLVETNNANNNNDENNNYPLPVGAPLLDAKISSDGSTVAFVADREVYVIPTQTNPSSPQRTLPYQVTFGARDKDGWSNGVADYLAQEELDRAEGFWLSPRGTRLVYEQVDESHIPKYRITHQGSSSSSGGGGGGDSSNLSQNLKAGTSCHEMTQNSKVPYEEHRYPFAGTENPIIKLGVVNTAKSSSTTANHNAVLWFDLDSVFGSDFYLAKVEWLAPPPPQKTTRTGTNNTDKKNTDSTKFVVQLLDRRQQKLALLLLDCETGSITLLHMEVAMKGAWINLHSMFRPLISAKKNDTTMRFLWASERDGYRHLYLLEAVLSDNGKENQQHGARVVKRLTGPGEFIVETIAAVDHDNKCLYYMGTSPGGWLDRHLFRVSFDDETTTTSSTQPVCLTRFSPGTHSCTVSVKLGLVVDDVSSVTKASVVSIYKLPALDDDTAVLQHLVAEIHDASKGDERINDLGNALQPPTFYTFPSTDGKVTLQAAVYTPDEAVHGKGPWPVVVATYGGPHVQYVSNTWGMMTADMRSQFLRGNGYAVIKVDNRGSNRRGLVFEAPIWGNLGNLEVADQVAGVEWAVKEGFADPNRVAVSGWSYGGYMALKCLTDLEPQSPIGLCTTLPTQNGTWDYHRKIRKVTRRARLWQK